MTNGIISVVKKGHVLAKIITGCDGNKLVGVVVDKIRKNPKIIDSATDLYADVLSTGFGSKDSLIVMTKNTIFHECNEEPDARYRETFNQARFNPRWENGSADFIEVVNL